MKSAAYAIVIFLVALTALTHSAQAYIGPGALVVALGYIFGPVAAVAVAVGLVLIWPAKILWSKIRKKKKETP